MMSAGTWGKAELRRLEQNHKHAGERGPTPGEWEARRLEADGFLIRRPGWEIRTDLWDVATWIEHGAPIRREADARLMAAAPDLLAACKSQDEYEQHVNQCSRCDWSENYCETGWLLWNTAQNLRAIALAKAKG